MRITQELESVLVCWLAEVGQLLGRFLGKQGQTVHKTATNRQIDDKLIQIHSHRDKEQRDTNKETMDGQTNTEVERTRKKVRGTLVRKNTFKI